MFVSILLSTLLVAPFPAERTASDTLALTLSQAEARFIDRNLNLIATKFNIVENKAYEIQAKRWNNPTIYVEQMPYNQQTRDVLPFKQSNAQQVVQVQQLLLLAGKRSKQLALAQTRTAIAADRFYDLVRTLKFQLRSSFYDLYYAQQTLSIYAEEISTLQRTVDVFQQQYDKGNVPLKDLSRLKAYLFNLTIEQQQLLRRINDNQATLAVLLSSDTAVPIRPVVDPADLSGINIGPLNTAEMLNTASLNRYDLKAVADQMKQEEQNVTLQRALAVPDLAVQATYDRNGSYVPHYFGVGVSIGIPVFDKNQGNIQAARNRVQSSQQAYNAYRLQVEADVERALINARQADVLFRKFDNRFTEGFGRLIQGVILNYQKQNIDVVEFIDFFDAYKSVQLQYNQLQNDRMQRIEELNFATGTNLFQQ